MNLIEAMVLLGSMVGGALVSGLLLAQADPALAVLGLPLGMVAGPFLFLGPFFAFGYLLTTYEEYQTDRSLQVHFGPFQSKNAEWLWEDVEQHVRVGQVVRGQVATRLDGELYVDVGLGFPARLRRWDAVDRTIFDSAWGGDRVEARVVGLDGERRIIELTQR
jgi:hypothetical protein